MTDGDCDRCDRGAGGKEGDGRHGDGQGVSNGAGVSLSEVVVTSFQQPIMRLYWS